MKDVVHILADINNKDISTMTMLQDQTNTFVKISKSLTETDGEVNRSDKVIRSMIKQVFTNKLVLVMLIFLVFLLNCVIIYSKIKSKF